MKLISCYVSSFGKLKDFKYDFTDGLNVIKQENGWGKSTFAAFIKAIFYGFEQSDGKHGIEENERKRFAPWNSTEMFGGYLIFEREGSRYKIERFFGGKRNEESVKLYDLATNKVYTDEKHVKDLGKRLFGIDEDGFLSTTYFSQKEFAVKSNSAIAAKFNEVCEVQGQESFENAVVAIEDKMRRIKVFRGEKGRLYDVKREMSALNDRIADVKQAVNSIDGLKKDEEVLQAQCDQLEKNITAITEELEKAGKRETAALRKKTLDALLIKKSEIERKLAAAEKTLNGERPTAEKIESCGACIDDLQRLSVKEETLIADINECSEKTVSNEKPSKKGAIIAGITAAAAIAAGIDILFTVGLIGLTLIGAGVLIGLFTLAAVLMRKKKADEKARSAAAIKQLADKKAAEINGIRADKEKLENALNAFFGKFTFNYETENSGYRRKLQIISDAVKERDALKAELDGIDADVAALGRADGAAAEETGCATVSELKEKLEVANRWLKDKISDKERIANRIETLKEQADKLFDLELKQKETQEEYAFLESEYRILSLTLDHLKNADETLKTRYREIGRASCRERVSLCV